MRYMDVAINKTVTYHLDLEAVDMRMLITTMRIACTALANADTDEEQFAAKEWAAAWHTEFVNITERAEQK